MRAIVASVAVVAVLTLSGCAGAANPSPSPSSTEYGEAEYFGKVTDGEFADSLRKEFPILKAASDRKLVKIAKDSCWALDVDIDYDTVLDVNLSDFKNPRAQDVRAMETIMKSGVENYCPYNEDKLK